MSSRPQYSTLKQLQLRKASDEKWGINLGVGVSPPFPVTVRHITEGSAASRSGLQKDDRITSVNGTYTLGLTRDKIHSLFSSNVVNIEYTKPLQSAEPVQPSHPTTQRHGITKRADSHPSTTPGSSYPSSKPPTKAKKNVARSTAPNAAYFSSHSIAHPPQSLPLPPPRSSQYIPTVPRSSIPQPPLPPPLVDYSIRPRPDAVQRPSMGGHTSQPSPTQRPPQLVPNVPPVPVPLEPHRPLQPKNSSVLLVSREVIDLVSDSSDEEEKDESPQTEQPVTNTRHVATALNISSGTEPTAAMSPRHSDSGHEIIELLDDSDNDADETFPSQIDDSMSPANLDILLSMLDNIDNRNPRPPAGLPPAVPPPTVLPSNRLPPSRSNDEVSNSEEGQPSLKKRRSEANDMGSTGDNFFCGVKVKLEPVTFGCADCMDVVEVRIADSDEKEEGSKIAAVNVIDKNLNDSQQGNDVDEDDDISYVGGNMTTMLEMPHARESCSVHPFTKLSLGVLCSPSQSNLKYCEFCYCYVCECKASECLYWNSHAQATHKNVTWKVERALLRSKLLMQLNPPVRRVDFIEQSLKPKIMDIGAGGDPKFTFNKVLDEVKNSISVVYDVKLVNKLEEYSYADFLEAVILLINILKKCQNDIRDGSHGHKAMIYLSRALLSSKMYTTSFTHPEMAEALRVDLSSLSNGIVQEFVKVILQLTVRESSSRVDWVQNSRLENRSDVPVAVEKLKSSFVAGIIFSALKDIGACPAAVLEFCDRQGDKFRAQCFYWLVDLHNVDAAAIALSRIPKANIRRELCQYFVSERHLVSRKSIYTKILKYCTLLAVIAPKYDLIVNADDLLCFYTSQMFRSGSEVHEQSMSLLNGFSNVPLQSVETYQAVQRAVDPETSRDISLTGVPAGMAVPVLYYVLLKLPCFSTNAIAFKPLQVKRFLTQVIFKDASAVCTLLFLYFFQVWGLRGRSQPDENITILSCEMARDIIAREKSLLLKLPQEILNRWSELTDECNLSEAFFPVTFTANLSDLRPCPTRAGRSLKNAPLASYVPLHLFSSIPELKEKVISQKILIMALMWKSVIVTVIDYIKNPSRHKMTSLVYFLQVLQGLDMDEQLSVMLKETMFILLFLEAASSHSSSNETNDADDYKLTVLLRRIVYGLKTSEDHDESRWLFWQALLSQVLRKVVGDSKFDILNLIIIEDWVTLNDLYFSNQPISVLSQKLKALTYSTPRDIDVKQKTFCMFIWQRIHSLYPSLINILAGGSEPTIINSLLYYAPDFISDLLPHPDLFRVLRNLVESPDACNVPENVIVALQSKWEDIQSAANNNLKVYTEENSNLKPSNNEFMLCIVLNLKDKFTVMFPKLESTQDLIDLFHKSKTVAETTFLVENSISSLRHEVLHNLPFRQQLATEFQLLEYFDDLGKVSSLSMIEIMAILFPTVQSISNFMSQKDEFDEELVTGVFSHFQQLLTNDFEGSSISIADAFELYTKYSDESSLQNFFFHLYTSRLNPLLCDKFISSCFAHMTDVGRDKCGMILSWLVAFCYRFYQDVNRSVLFSLQKNLLEFLRHVDFYDYNLTGTCQGSLNSNNGLPAVETDANLPSKEQEISESDVYCSLKVNGEDDLQLLHPKYAFNFLQLIIYPQTEKYDVLPMSLLSPTMKRVTLHFLFDIEHPVVFLSTALRRSEFSCLNEKIVNIPLDNPHWAKILETILAELQSGALRPDDENGMPAKRSRAAPFNASAFLLHSMELLVKLQVMSTHPVCSFGFDNIKGIFYHLNGLLKNPLEQCILKNVVDFKADSLLKLVSDAVESRAERSVFDEISELCFFTATARWYSPPHKLYRYVELVKLKLSVGGDSSTTPLGRVLQKLDFRIPMESMMVGVFPQALSLLNNNSTEGEVAYISSLQSMISVVRSESSDIAVSLLPFVIECLNSKFLLKAMTSFHLTSGYLTSALWVQFVNDLSSRVPDHSSVMCMTFLCQVASSLHCLTSTTFFEAVESAARNNLAHKWLIVLLDLITVDGLLSAQDVASFVFSIPKNGVHYSSDFWQHMYCKISNFHLPSLAMAICTEGRCHDDQFMAALTSHSEILSRLTVDLDPNELLGESNQGLHVIWSAILKYDESFIVRMMKNLVTYFLSERMTAPKKILFSTFLSRMKSLYFKACKFDQWREFCKEASVMSTKKKTLLLILNDAMSAAVS